MSHDAQPVRSDEFLSEEDLDLQNLSPEELETWWNAWLEASQITNEEDRFEYAHGVFRRDPTASSVAGTSPQGRRYKGEVRRF